ncbi:unnamed protein product [Gongylonema pulchrum]|uniref:MIF4G domain-containing protein n=1 Tax=Gongylonema pulchrum TaxID=637853 RepID=A0A183EMJ3_9BILA|nr:unnamed protein product [Gongylonema pulchrum]VDN40056.1 unnamed protein product [Gongylonema pulchrum]
MLLEKFPPFNRFASKRHGEFEDEDDGLPENERNENNRRRQIEEICRPLMLSDADLKRVMEELVKAMETGLATETGTFFCYT